MDPNWPLVAGSTVCRSRSSRWFEVSVTRSRRRSRISRSFSGSCSPGALALRCLRNAALTNASTSAAGTRPTEPAVLGLSLQHGLRDVVTVAHTTLVGVAGAHTVAAIVKQAPGQKGGRAAQPAAPRHGLGGKLGLHGLEQRPSSGSARGRHDEPRPGRPPRRCRTDF